MRSRGAVFLDRDGVLNEALLVDGRAMSPTSPTELRLVPGVAATIRRLREAQWLLVVVTNQPDIAKGLIEADIVETMNESLKRALGLDAVYVCPHDAAARCECRKPLGGMLRRAAYEHGVDFALSWMVGDRWVDVAAGVDAGVRTILLERPYSWSPTSSGNPPEGLQAFAVVADLEAAVEIILADGGQAARA